MFIRNEVYYFFKINTFTLNSYIGFALLPYYTNSELESIYIIFGESEQKNNDIVLNLTEDFKWKISDGLNIDINNNLFGYELLYKIKLVEESLQNLIFYSVNKNQKIGINEKIEFDDSLSFDYSNISIKIEEQPFFEILAIIIEPDYDKSISLCDKLDIYGEEPKNFYERKIIDEKIIKIKINFGCYLTCETCEYAGFNMNKQNCLSCKDNNYCFMEKEGNCYDILALKYNFYKDLEDENTLKCVPYGDYCINEYPFEIINTKECVKECNYEDLINKIKSISNTPNSITSIFDIIYNKIKEGSLDEDIEKEIIIYGNNVTVQLSNTYNQKNNIDNNMKANFSFIDLSECETKLGLDKSLILVKMDINKSDSFVPQVEYLIINPNTHEIIDLSICEDTKINLYLPFNIPEESLNLYNFANEQGYNIFNPSDSFYNDICTPFNSYNKTDVLIKDRKEDFYHEEYALCEEGCNYEVIDINLNKIKCKCEIKKEIKHDSKFSSNTLLENFYKINSYSNFRIIVCHLLVFSKEGQKNNYGSYIILSVMILFISTTIISIITNSKKTNKILESILEQQKKIININNIINQNQDLVYKENNGKPKEIKLENIEINPKIKIKKKKKKKRRQKKLN